jgi:hypothetical protein
MLGAGIWGLSLVAAGNIALVVAAGAAIVGLAYAAIEVRISRASSRLTRLYAYADRFNRPETLAASASYRDYWERHSVDDYLALPRTERLELMMMPNLVEEVAFLYNRRLLDRNVAAELLGIYVETLWDASQAAVIKLRIYRNNPALFSEWEEMRADTPRRTLRGIRAAERRRTRRIIVEYWKPGSQMPDF